MNQDGARNRFFEQAIEAAARRRAAGPWLEIGCGASALLTTMAARRVSVVAVEGNAESASHARRMLRQSGLGDEQARVVEGFSGTPVGEAAPFSAVLFEIFGFIASAEGVVAALESARGAYRLDASARSIPSRALTRVVPVDVDADALARNTPTLYCSEKLLLAKRYPVDRDSLCSRDASGVGTFEDVDCAALLAAPPGEAAAAPRTFTSDLVVARAGLLSGLALYVVLQAGCARPRRWPASRFGDDQPPRGAADDQPPPVLWTSSNHADDAAAVSTNWLNPILLLPHAVRVEAGKAIHLEVDCWHSGLSPSLRRPLLLRRAAGRHPRAGHGRPLPRLSRAQAGRRRSRERQTPVRAERACGWAGGCRRFEWPNIFFSHL